MRRSMSAADQRDDADRTLSPAQPPRGPALAKLSPDTPSEIREDARCVFVVQRTRSIGHGTTSDLLDVAQLHTRYLPAATHVLHSSTARRHPPTRVMVRRVMPASATPLPMEQQFTLVRRGANVLLAVSLLLAVGSVAQGYLQATTDINQFYGGPEVDFPFRYKFMSFLQSTIPNLSWSALVLAASFALRLAAGRRHDLSSSVDRRPTDADGAVTAIWSDDAEIELGLRK